MMPRVTSSGSGDITRAAGGLGRRIPEALAPLARLAYTYRWAWAEGGPDLFRAVDPERWAACGENPVRLLEEAPLAALERAAADHGLLERAAALEALVQADLARPADPGAAQGVSAEHPVAFFCAEFGFHRSLPIYSGGLGALAGDILKEASDLAFPLVGVGLMYRQGYFRQRIDAHGRQQEYWVDTDPERTPAVRVTGADGAPLRLSVPIDGDDVAAQLWRVDVGRVPLYLLDVDLPENPPAVRWISARLYVGDPQTRLAQYTLLGVGGVRALHALGIEPGLVHLNEGHGALAALELAGPHAGEDALAAARERVIFTTHTPVPAGNDTYPPGQVLEALERWLPEAGLEPDAFLALGRTDPQNPGEDFGVTQIALRRSRAANGVSRRHGEVAREMWQGLWPGTPVDDVPIGYVTNGVHLPTWLGGPMRELLDRTFGEDWLLRADDPATWAPLEQVADEELWAVRRAQRGALVEYVRARSVADRLSRGEPRPYAEAAARAFDPDVLTIGFARRLATYKRLDLLVRNPERHLRLISGDRPVQLVLAGKAHPKDEEGKRLVEGLFTGKNEPSVAERVVYLDDYDLGSAAELVRGCDVWVNLPRPPLEASGTSGMKCTANGGLHLSVLDGWWAEGYDGHNGWALSGETASDPVAQDTRDSLELYRLLEDEIVPEFYEHDAGGLPRAWLARVRRSLMTNGPAFAASRMVRDYQRRFYA